MCGLQCSNYMTFDMSVLPGGSYVQMSHVVIHVLYICEVVIIVCVPLPRFVVRENKLLFCCHKADCIHLKVVFMNFDWWRHTACEEGVHWCVVLPQGDFMLFVI